MDYVSALPLLFRGSERLLIVAAAIVCIILGYKLFKIVPFHQESEGKFKFGDLSVNLTKVGPGVFFSLFGAFVLFQSVLKPLDMSALQQDRNQANEQIYSIRLSNINWLGTTGPINDDLADRAMGPIKILNCLAKQSDSSKVDIRRIETAIHSAKVAIIADVWQPSWGDSDSFVQLNMGNVDEGSPIGKIYYAIDEGC